MSEKADQKPKDDHQINIRLHFKDHVSEEAGGALWNEIFNILGVFDDQIKLNP